MLFLLSPAKKLEYTSVLSEKPTATPIFHQQAATLIAQLKKLSISDIQNLMGISPALATLNHQRFQDWSLESPKQKAPAVYAFAGDVYQGLDVHTLAPEAQHWIHNNLMILSGLYGILRPTDALQPYRLEMGTRFANPKGTNLYAFWSDWITDWLNQQSQADTIVNLASEEYAKVLNRKILKRPCIDCIFQEYKNGSYKVIGIHAKHARGRLLRYAAEQGVSAPHEIQQFNWDGYQFDASASNATTYVFRRNSAS